MTSQLERKEGQPKSDQKWWGEGGVRQKVTKSDGGEGGVSHQSDVICEQDQKFFRAARSSLFRCVVIRLTLFQYLWNTKLSQEFIP